MTLSLMGAHMNERSKSIVEDLRDKGILDENDEIILEGEN